MNLITARKFFLPLAMLIATLLFSVGIAAANGLASGSTFVTDHGFGPGPNGQTVIGVFGEVAASEGMPTITATIFNDTDQATLTLININWNTPTGFGMSSGQSVNEFDAYFEVDPNHTLSDGTYSIRIEAVSNGQVILSYVDHDSYTVGGSGGGSCSSNLCRPTQDNPLW